MWNNGTVNYSWTPVPSLDISVDPMLADSSMNPHVQPGSQCIEGGWNEAPGLPAKDMDGEDRILGTNVDIGVDESTGADWDSITITANPAYCAVDQQLVYTVKVKDETGQPISGVNVRVSVTGSRISAITNNTVQGTIDTPPLSGECVTNDVGEIYVTIIAGDNGVGNCFMTIEAEVVSSGGGSGAMMSASGAGAKGLHKTYCTDPNAPIGLVICHDVSGLMGGGAAAIGGIAELDSFVQTNAPWITVTVYPFGADDCENHMDAFFTSLSMLSSSCRKLIAMATDEPYHCGTQVCNGPSPTCPTDGVISAMTAAGAEVYLDCGGESQWYTGLDVNGAFKDGQGVYHFPKLKQAILNNPNGLDIRTDSNNDTIIDWLDDYVEEYLPGRVVAEGDLAEITISHPLNCVSQIVLVANVGSQNTRVWASAAKENQIMLPAVYNVGVDTVPSTIYVEGVSPGEAVLDMVMKNTDGTETGRDRIRSQ